MSGCIEYYEARAFLIWLTPDNIPETCTIVLRMPFTENEQPYKKYKSDELLRQMGLNDNGEVIMKKKKKLKKGKFIKKRTVCKQLHYSIQGRRSRGGWGSQSLPTFCS